MWVSVQLGLRERLARKLVPRASRPMARLKVAEPPQHGARTSTFTPLGSGQNIPYPVFYPHTYIPGTYPFYIPRDPPNIFEISRSNTTYLVYIPCGPPNIFEI